MDPILQKLLDRIKSSVSGVGGCVMGSAYLQMVIPCAEEAGCNLELHKDATADQWLAAVKVAQKTLTHSSPGSIVLGGKFTESAFGDDEHLKDLTPGAAMDYVTVLTSINEDRDEDVLHPKGANIDPAMPLLYHHNPVWPIGKLVKTVYRSDKIIKIHNSIAATQMGEEAAYLVEFGGLRTSHGFRAKKITERKGSSGYEIHEYDVFESSLVPVPSNLDAVVTAHARGKLKSAVNRAWAAEIKKSLAKTVVGGFSPPDTKAAKDEGACRCPDAVKNRQPAYRFTPKESAAASGKKELGIPARLGYDGQVWVGVCLASSYEWVSEELEEDAKSFLMANNIRTPDYSSVVVLGTYDESCIVATLGGYGEGQASFYRCGWSMVGGEPTLSGTPTEVELAVEVTADDDEKSATPDGKSLAAALKSSLLDGAVLKMSRMILAKLKRAKDLMHSVRTSDELKPATKASADSAHSLMMSILRDKKSPGQVKLAKMTIAKLKQVKELADHVHSAAELKEPTRAAARSARDVVAQIIASSKSADAESAAADFCRIVREDGSVGSGTAAAVREEIAAAEDAALAKAFATV